MRVSEIAGGAPAWVYVLLFALIVLGVRRLRTRETPVGIALIAPAAFLIWSVLGVDAFAHRAGAGLAIGTWLGGAAIGVLTTIVLPEPRGQILPAGRVRQPGSRIPLVLYLGVFVVRFACGAWAAIVPAQAVTATATGLAVSAAMTARLAVGVLRWQRTA